MITGVIKHEVDAVWQTFWNKGFTQPSAVFEQITYLLFMKMLDDKQLEKESIANLTGVPVLNPTFFEGVWHNPSTDQDVSYNEMRWHVFKNMEPGKILNWVRNGAFIFLRYIGGEGSAYSKAMPTTKWSTKPWSMMLPKPLSPGCRNVKPRLMLPLPNFRNS